MLKHVIFGNVTVYDLFLTLLIAGCALLLSRILATYVRRAFRDKVTGDHLQIIVKSIYYGIMMVAVLMILPMLGFELSGILVAGGLAGVVIGFASQNIVSNLISGVFLMVERPIKIGNAVSIEGTSGIVKDINIISTIIRTWDGLFVRIPNIKVFTGNLTNFMAHIARRFSYTIGIRYRDDAAQAIEIIKQLIDDHPYTLKNPPPLVYVTELGESSVNIQISIWAPTSEWFTIKNEMLWKIKSTLEENGIQVPFPQRVVWMEKD